MMDAQVHAGDTSKAFVHEARRPAVKASQAAHAQHSGDAPSSSVQEASRLAPEAGPQAQARDRLPPASSPEMSTSASSPPVRVPFSEEAAENDSDLPGMDAGLDRQSGLLYVDDSIVRDLNDARGHVDLGAAKRSSPRAGAGAGARRVGRVAPVEKSEPRA